MLDEIAELQRFLAAAEARIQELEAALREIQKGEGPFDRYPYLHALNCINHMKILATNALNASGKGGS